MNKQELVVQTAKDIYVALVSHTKPPSNFIEPKNFQKTFKVICDVVREEYEILNNTTGSDIENKQACSPKS